MRVVVQRVKHASVTIDGNLYNKIDNGLLLLVGFCSEDDDSMLDKVCNKIANLRIFEDENQKMNLSALDLHLEVLSISQFTLYADVKKGRRPSFDKAMKQDEARVLYNKFNECMSKYLPCKTGIFQADMKIELLNDGPVTIIVDSENL